MHDWNYNVVVEARLGVINEIRPVQWYVNGGEILRSPWPHFKIFLTCDIESGKVIRWPKDESLPIIASTRHPDKLVGFSIFIREHRELPDNGRLEIWSTNYGTEEFFHWTFPHVVWESVTAGRWGGVLGKTVRGMEVGGWELVATTGGTSGIPPLR